MHEHLIRAPLYDDDLHWPNDDSTIPHIDLDWLGVVRTRLLSTHEELHVDRSFRIFRRH